MFERELQPRFTVFGLQHTPAVFAQPMGKRIAESGIVIDQQSGFHGGYFFSFKEKDKRSSANPKPAGYSVNCPKLIRKEAATRIFPWP